MVQDGRQDKLAATSRSPVATSIDPARAASYSDFISLLRELRRVSDVSYGELAKFAKNSNSTVPLPKSTISEALADKRTIGRQQVREIVRACGLTSTEIDVWDAAWAKCTKDRTEGIEGDRKAIDRQIALRDRQIVMMQRRVDELFSRERSLQADLDKSLSRLCQMQADLTAAQQEAAAERHRAERLEERKQELERQIIDFKAKLQPVVQQRRSAEAERDRLRAENHELSSFGDALSLHYDHVQYERKIRQQAEQQVVEMAGELTELRARLKDMKPLHNWDAVVELPVKVEPIGSRHTALLTYEWFCPVCERGGGFSYQSCPYCGRPTTRGHRVPITVRLNTVQEYGQHIRYPQSGYVDTDLAPAGDVYVRIVRDQRRSN